MMSHRMIVVAGLLACCLCAAQAQESSKERIEAFTKLPDWSGMWQFDMWADELDGQQLGAEGLRRAKAYAAALQPSYTPAWQPRADQFKKMVEAAFAPDPNPPGGGSGCNAAPRFPATMQPGYYEWRVTPEETTLVSSLGSVRHIYTDGRPHPPKDELWPTNQGDSVGRWDGHTLIVDTVAVKPPRLLLASGEEVLATAGPFSAEFHAVERVSMVNHDEMQIQFTVSDPVALAKPLNVTITWVRVKDLNRMEENEQECEPAADRNPVVNGRVTTIVKPAPPTPTEPTGR
jgi:hypothetical protein